MPDSPERRPRVVIVGAGFGGLSTAQALAHAPVDVTVIDRHNYHLFQPLLYQVATAGLPPADIASPIRSILARAKSIAVMLARVTAIDTQAGAPRAAVARRMTDRLARIRWEAQRVAIRLCNPAPRPKDNRAP